MNAPAIQTHYDVAVIGGGPAGAVAAHELRRKGHSVLLVDRPGRIKPCGGAIPPRLLDDFALPHGLLRARASGARISAPSGARVDMSIANGFVGMVDRDEFDPWLRARAEASGVRVVEGRYEHGSNNPSGGVDILLLPQGDAKPTTVTCRALIGADGANSRVRGDFFDPSRKPPYVFAYHEIVEAPADIPEEEFSWCDVVYDARISPDFYGWVFPHGRTISVGVGSAVKGFDLKEATALLRRRAGLTEARTIRREGAPLPLKALRRWDDGRSVLLAGDAAGIVAPASGEGIYYAMTSGRLAAIALDRHLTLRDARALGQARRSFMKAHGNVFMILGMMQSFWYRTDRRRERFVAICGDPDVQRLSWESYLEKRLVRADPIAHLRVVVKDVGHMLRLAFS